MVSVRTSVCPPVTKRKTLYKVRENNDYLLAWTWWVIVNSLDLLKIVRSNPYVSNSLRFIPISCLLVGILFSIFPVGFWLSANVTQGRGLVFCESQWQTSVVFAFFFKSPPGYKNSQTQAGCLYACAHFRMRTCLKCRPSYSYPVKHKKCVISWNFVYGVFCGVLFLWGTCQRIHSIHTSSTKSQKYVLCKRVRSTCK